MESKPRKLVVSVRDAFKIIDHLGGKDMKFFDNIIGYEHIKIELERLVDCINNKEKYTDDLSDKSKNRSEDASLEFSKASIAKSTRNFTNKLFRFRRRNT